jgi:hypothetical protein
MRRDRYVRPRAKVFTGYPFEPVMWSIGILLIGAITALLRLYLKNVFMGVAYDKPPVLASGQFDVPASVSQCPFRKPVFPLRSKCPCMLVLIAFELVADPEQRAIDHGAVVAGQFDNPGLDDKTAEFDEKPRPLAALDLPLAHVTSRPCRLMVFACRPVAPERRLERASAIRTTIITLVCAHPTPPAPLPNSFILAVVPRFRR